MYSTWYSEHALSSDLLTGNSQVVDGIVFSSTTSDSGILSPSPSAGPEIASIDFGESKKQYNLYGDNGAFQTYNTTTSMMSLISPLAQFDSGEISDFGSQTQELAGLASLYSVAEAEGVSDFISPVYNEMLILTTYPVWNGHRIVHDPTFSTISTRHNAYTELPPDSTGNAIPGFTITAMLSLLALAVIGVTVRRLQARKE